MTDEKKLIAIGCLKNNCNEPLMCKQHGMILPCDLCDGEASESVICTKCHKDIAQLPLGYAGGAHTCNSIDVYRKTGTVIFDVDPVLEAQYLEAEEAARKQKKAEERRRKAEQRQRKAEERRLVAERQQRENEKDRLLAIGCLKTTCNEYLICKIHGEPLPCALCFGEVSPSVMCNKCHYEFASTATVSHIEHACKSIDEYLEKGVITFDVDPAMETRYLETVEREKHALEAEERRQEEAQRKRERRERDRLRREERRRLEEETRLRDSEDAKPVSRMWGWFLAFILVGLAAMFASGLFKQEVDALLVSEEKQQVISGHDALKYNISPKTNIDDNKQINSNSNASKYIQEMIQASINRDDASVRILKEKIESLPKPSKPNKANSIVARAQNDIGLSELAMGNFSDAIRIFESAVQDDPSDVEIVNNYGYALFKNGNFDKALDALFATLLLNPERANAWRGLGFLYAVTNEHQKAVACFSNEYRMSKNPNETHEFFLKRLSEETKPEVRAVLKEVTSERENKLKLSDIEPDKHSAPIPTVIPTIEGKPDQTIAGNKTGISYIMQMISASVIRDEPTILAYKDKIKLLDKPERGNRKLARKLNDEGLAYIAENNFSSAISVLEQATVADPVDPEIINNLAYALQKNGNFDQALDTLFATLLLNPERTNAWSGLGFLYAMTNESQKAVACFSNAYRMSKNPPKTHEFFLKALSEEKKSSVISVLETVTTEWAVKLNINQPGSHDSTLGSSFEPRSEKTAVTITLTDLRKQADKLIAQKNFSEALPIVQKMIELNDAEAQNNLGYFYLTGKGIRKDEHKAVEWFSKAANQGYLTAQTNLGLLYLNGIGVPAESSSAFTWFEKAANQGDANAQYNLGLLHQNGEGVPTDLNKGIYWLRKSAAQGHTDAQSALYKIKDMADSNRMAEGVDAEMVDGQQSPFVPDFYARGKWAASNANFERAYYDCKIGAFRRANTNTTGFANDPNNPYKREYISCMHEAGFNVDR